MWKDRASGRVEMFSKDEENESKEDQENEELIYDINVNDFWSMSDNEYGCRQGRWCAGTAMWTG